jgi:hypothetical protein
MPVHVGETISEVTVEPDANAAPAAAPQAEAGDPEPLRDALARLALDQRRTAAEGYDD